MYTLVLVILITTTSQARPVSATVDFGYLDLCTAAKEKVIQDAKAARQEVVVASCVRTK